MRARNFIGGLAVVCAAAAGQPGSAAAAPDGSASLALCVFTAHEQMTPPATLTPQALNDAGSGPITCNGRLGGKTFDGRPGTATWDAQTGLGIFGIRDISDCIADTGTGRMAMSLTASDGSIVELSGSLFYGGVGPVGLMTGTAGGFELTTVSMTGPDPDYPEENCVTVPMQHVVTTAAVLLRG
ncbi:hypothetical protein LTV02_28575 [Nocardia yamanashiensis]|uniref:hypothetical protein n=1 Tax=Nocardia yamanashiensis TaxID=209247 RepID=UPI001E640DEC|nr:hypothetical protein [Nocardia yamanashiensis]UGT39973.1 hypothetical protein LTV02_28575 [Nocardia yamanashiensis]